MGLRSTGLEPIVLVIDFHHARGPEVELCFCADGTDPCVENDWSLLPFMALSDGAHASTEDFSYFTLQRTATDTEPATSLFGISCTRQIDTSALIYRPPEVTRSTVQKAVVVVTDEPKYFGQLRERLSMVTSAWFAQCDFSDSDILKKFQESLSASLKSDEAENDRHLGLSLREMIHEFKHQTLVLFKCLLLQPKMLFFGSRCERLCMIQFSLISLIPGLILHLRDCADPSFDSYEKNVAKPTSLKTSERSSLLAYMGLPLQIFGKGSMFGPYTPLQQLDLLADHGTKSYVVGSTNSLLLQQKDRYSDILINLDEDTISIASPSLRNALALSAADRRWIDFLTQTINETWDEDHPERPKDHGYMGSEEFIRLQFEEYLLALLSSVKYHEELTAQGAQDRGQASDIEGDPALEFNTDFLNAWQTTPNYALFKRLTSDALLFSIVEPRHPCAGGLTIDDIQRRIGQQVADLHLDERVREGREALNKHLATGQKKVSSAFNNFWADIEAMREAQRKKNEERAQQAGVERRPSMDKESVVSSPTSPRASTASSTAPGAVSSWFGAKKPPVDLSNAQASVSVARQQAGAYFSSWGAWASEKRKDWQEKRVVSAGSTSSSPTLAPSTAGALPEKVDLDRGRHSLQRNSEDSAGSSSVNRSLSRRKRWSSVFRKSMDSISLSVGHDDEKGDVPSRPPRSPLSTSTRFSFDQETVEQSAKTETVEAETLPTTAATTDLDASNVATKETEAKTGTTHTGAADVPPSAPTDDTPVPAADRRVSAEDPVVPTTEKTVPVPAEHAPTQTRSGASDPSPAEKAPEERSPGAEVETSAEAPSK